VLLGLLPEKATLAGEDLAAFLGIPFPYLAKQLQALSRSGIVKARRGVAGGYRLNTNIDDLSLWDITASIEGTSPSFRCTEVRQNGPCGAPSSECSRPCFIAAAFRQAEAEFRESLASVKLTEIVVGVTGIATKARKQEINTWIEQHASITQ
ncbi:MAG: Rrf2 family transcriptional regulator, partial [Pseudomonadota bacterium]